MDFKTAVRTCLFRKYSDFKGRASRSEFWWFVLFGAIVNSFLGLFSNASPQTGMLTSGIVSLMLLLPHLAVTARRLHDANLSGWVQAAPIGLAALGGLATAINQSWMQYAPQQAIECGFGDPTLLEMTVNWLSLQWPSMFMVTGFCTQKDWVFLGLSLANWSVLFFAALALGGVLAFRRRTRRAY